MKFHYYISLFTILSYCVCCNCTHSEIENTSDEYTSLICVRKNGKFGYINDKGEEVIPCKFDFTSFFSEGWVGLQKGKKWAYYNAKGEKVLDLKKRFTFCGEFHNGVALVSTEPRKEIPPNHASYYEDLCQEELIFINKKSEVIFQIENEWGVDCIDLAMYGYSDDFLRLKTELPDGQKKIGFLDKNGQLKIPFKLFERGSYVSEFTDGLAIGSVQNHSFSDEGPKRKFGYVNKTGEWETPPIYDNAYPFNCGVAVVGELVPDQKYKMDTYLIDKRGNRVFPPDVTIRNLQRRDSLVAVGTKIENESEIGSPLRYALAKVDGTLITDFLFSSLNPGETSEDWWTVRLPGKKEVGFIDDKGTLVIPYKFSVVSENFEKGMAVVREKDKKGEAVINKKGEYVMRQDKNVDYHIISNGGVIYAKDEAGEEYYYNKDGQLINLESYEILGLFNFLPLSDQ